MKLIGAIVFIVSVSQAIALCTDLKGTWRSQINSNLSIESITGDVFSGTYTAVDSAQGAAVSSSKVSGVIKIVENGALVGFTLVSNKGVSLTTWVGQCIVCDGKEKIFTTWAMRCYEPPLKRWMSNSIHQDTFWRTESAAEEGLQSSQTGGYDSSSGLQGKWITNWGETIDITEVHEQGTWKGTHNVVGENGVLVTGRFDGNETYTAVAFIAASSNKIRGLIGHMDDPESKVLETSWLEHAFHHNCTDPRKIVNFSVDNYNRT